MRGLATSGGVVVPSFDRAARTGHKVSGGGGGGGIGRVAFFRRFFTMAAIKTVIESARSDVDGNSAQTASSDGQEGTIGGVGSEAIVAQRAATGWRGAIGTKVLRLFNTLRSRNASPAYNAGQSRLRDLAACKTLASASSSLSRCLAD